MDYAVFEAIEHIATLHNAQMLLNKVWRERPDERLANMINDIQSLILEIRQELPDTDPQPPTFQLEGD